MQRLLILFILMAFAAPIGTFAHASDEPHEEPPVAETPSQTPAAVGGFLIGVAVGMIFTKLLLARGRKV